ncbi:MAG: hypothetical protein QOK17_136 [Sphingomonadales bacterium]|jgi:hypothetical protein|nr:hypothetical protein [Sphingomonadales bacterium]
MIARGFKSVIWVAAVGAAALGCYMVSLRVATERADLARVEGQILAAKRDIRSLQTELGTRGRMTQLEDWNSNVLALSAPSSAQFVRDQVTLARLERHEPTVAQQSAEIRMASADTAAAGTPADPDVAAPTAPPKPAQRVVSAVAAVPPPAPALIRQASYTPEAPLKAKPAPTATPAPASAKNKLADPAGAAKPAVTARATPTSARPKPLEIAAATKPAKPKPAPIAATAAPAKAKAIAATVRQKPVRAAAAAPSHDKPAPRTASAAPRGGKGGGSSGR